MKLWPRGPRCENGAQRAMECARLALIFTHLFYKSKSGINRGNSLCFHAISLRQRETVDVRISRKGAKERRVQRIKNAFLYPLCLFAPLRLNLSSNKGG
jgi:hypothetical protein